MTDLAARDGLLATIRSGDFAAVPVLADWLEDAGEDRKAVLLRRRFKLWQGVMHRCKMLEEAGTRKVSVRDLQLVDVDSGLPVFGMGHQAGSATLSFELDMTTSLQIERDHQNALLIAYCERIFALNPRTRKTSPLS